MKHRIATTLLMLTALLGLTFAIPVLPTTAAQEPNRVGLVIDFGDGSVMTRCITFSESEITGYEVLSRAGLSLVTYFDAGLGAGICKIEDQGCPKSSCMTCDAPNYWSYWHLNGNSWAYSQRGASSHVVQDGDVEGWRWGTGDPPSRVAFNQICAPPATDTPQPTSTPVPPTSTPIPPTNTPVPPTDTPPPTSPPEPEVWFRLDDNPIPAGSCTMLRWDTSSAQEVYLDGEPVDIIGSRQVCPSEPTDFELRVVGLQEEETHQLTLGVTGSAATATYTPQPTTAPPSPTDEAEPLSTAASATPETTEDPSPSPTPTLPSTATSSPSVQPEVSPSLSAAATTSIPPTVATEETQWEPSRTPAQVAAGEDKDEPREEEGTTAAENDSPSALVPLGYIVFSLIVGGLLGWLIYILRFRRQDA